MSRRRKPQPDGRILVKVGCTGQRSHKRLIFDTVSVDANLETMQFTVSHNADSRGAPVRTNTPDRIDFVDGKLTYINRVYKCPICRLDFPISSVSEGEKIFGPVAAAGVSFLDLSDLRSTLSK